MQLTDMTWAAVQELSKDTPVVIPIAALEQHGKHMPLFTDSMLLGEVMRRSSERLADKVLFAPLMWLGNSDHHMDFPGTLSASPRLYLGLLDNLLENFITHGFRRLVLVNGHGGNIVPSSQAVFEVRQRHRHRSDLLLMATTYWTLGGKPYEVNTDLEQRRMGHACEWETSMMLRIAPHLVGDLTKVEPVPMEQIFPQASLGWITKDRSLVGHIGDARHATAEKGETLFSVFTDDVVQFLQSVVTWKPDRHNAK